ncbi:hypothetical protein M3Y97_00578100 [Aphelenchoides bicaudatus]|nr:hypothetical protein M3Y97_00578100 [Aphelenchoides bicaudatus]
MRRGLQFLITVVTFGVAIGQANDLNFCTKYATCRSNARSQLMKCTGGISQMILAKHASNINVKDEAEKIKLCNKRYIHFFISSVSEYEFIDKKILECTKSAHSNTNPLEKTQELICQAIHKETDFDNAAIHGIQKNSECYQVYESELNRCNLIRDCCPQFESCRDKVEKESGILLREKGIVWRIKKCIDNPALNETLRAHDDVVAPSTSTQGPNPLEALLPHPTPVPRTKNNTLTANGRIFVIKPPQKQPNRSTQAVTESTTESAIKLNVTQDDSTKIEASKKEQKTDEKTSSNSILNEMLCRQTSECISILQNEERECDITFGQDKSDESGIKDLEIRAIFLNNSQTDDLQIRRKCLANVDKETQKHLIHLKKQIKKQDEQCAYDNAPDNLDLGGCQKIDLLSEFSLLKRANSDQLIDSLDKCKRRLVTFRQTQMRISKTLLPTTHQLRSIEPERRGSQIRCHRGPIKNGANPLRNTIAASP